MSDKELEQYWIMFYKEVKHKHLVEDFTQVSFLYNRNSKEQESLRDIHHFLSILKTSNFHNISGKGRFLKNAAQFFMKGPLMFKCRPNHAPLLVILKLEKRLSILTHA